MTNLVIKHLNPELKKLNDEVNKLNITNRIFTRKWSPQMKNKLKTWMYTFITNFDILVKEFNHSKITLENQKIRTDKKTNPTLYILLLEFIEKYPEDIKKICSDSLGEESFILLKKSCLKGPEDLGEWINTYSNQIYRSDTNSWINVLESYTKKSTNHKINLLGERLVNHLNQYNEFMSFQIQRDIEKGFLYLYKYQDNHLIFEVESDYKIDLESHYWKFLYARMKIMARMHQKRNLIRFKIYLSKQTKKLPTKKLFGPKEVNSGSTNYHTINIWREEEHYKLIIHESIHFYNLDGSLDLFDENNKINLECSYQIGDHNETRIYEAYTESLTIFFHTFANAYQIYYLSNLEFKPNLLDKKIIYNDIYDLWCILWEKERKFGVLQVARIYNHINPTSTTISDFLIKSNKTCKKERTANKYKLEQRTAVLSYHFLKTANLIFDQEFLKWIPDLNDPHPGSLIKFTKFVKTLTHNSDFINIINDGLTAIRNKKNTSNSMRMSFYDIKK
jgi:hypothetical protein